MTVIEQTRQINLTWQAYPEIEHNIINGVSTDYTLEIIKTTPNLFSEPDKCIYDAINKGIRLVARDVICIIHAEDVFASPKIKKAILRETRNG